MALQLNAEQESSKQPDNTKPRWNPFEIFVLDIRRVLKADKLGRELTQIAFPAALALAADPLASLIDTGFIGKIGPVQLAAAGVSIAIFNQISKVFNFPLVSVTTSLVAEEDALAEMAEGEASKPANSKDDTVASPQKDDHEDHGENEESSKDVEACVEKAETATPVNNPADAEHSGGEMDENSEPLKDLEAGDVKSENSEPLRDLETGNAKHESSEPFKDLEAGDVKDETCEKPVVDADVSNKNDETSTSTGFNKKNLSSVSSALVFGVLLGVIQVAILVGGAQPILRVMGVHPGSSTEKIAVTYLRLRGLSAPAVVMSLAIQGVFRGFKDTKTPLFATVTGNICNIALDPLLMFTFKFGVNGAAIAHTVSQYLVTVILLWRLSRICGLWPKKLSDVQFAPFFKNGTLLIFRVASTTFIQTLAASMAARIGTSPMAAFQICLQIWIATSLLADSLALAGQTILATAFARVDYGKVKKTTARTLQMGFVLGMFLAAVLGATLRYLSRVFTKDVHVLQMMSVAIPFVAGTMPINTLAFVFDGINFGAADFAYATYSMLSVAVISIVCLLVMSPRLGFVGIWIGLTIMMTLRLIAGVWRLATATGPWRFLRGG